MKRLWAGRSRQPLTVLENFVAIRSTTSSVSCMHPSFRPVLHMFPSGTVVVWLAIEMGILPPLSVAVVAFEGFTLYICSPAL